MREPPHNLWRIVTKMAKRPFSLSIRSSNDRLRILYPNSEKVIASLDVFSPPQAPDDESSNPRDEEARGQITAFTAGMADQEDRLATVDGLPLAPVEGPYEPSSALEPENPGYDELANPTASREAPSHTPEVAAVQEEVRNNFPATPRPDLRIIKDE